MLPKWHILIGFIASYILIQFFNFSLLAGITIFISSWLIDIDHYLWYAITEKDWNPIHAMKWFHDLVEKHKKLTREEKRELKKHILVFHGIEFWTILFLLGFFVNEIFYFILIGVGIHMVADWAYGIFTEAIWYAKISQLVVMIRNKKKIPLTS